MPPDHSRQASRSVTRAELIAALHREHAGELEQRVARRAHADHQTIEDACSFAWLQLLTHQSVDLSPPRTIGWLTQTATREAWRLAAARARERPLDHGAIEFQQRMRGQLAPGADQLAAQRGRLDLVDQIPARPRRFLLRLAVGYGYREIAAAEHVSDTTTNKQIARAKRQLRDIAADQTPQRRLPPAAYARIGDEQIAA